MIFIGGILGIIGFFLPWYTISLFGLNDSASGFTAARNGQASNWFFPIMMGAALFLSWLHLNSTLQKRIMKAGWLIAIGAAWTWSWLNLVLFSKTGISIGIGGYLSALASILILVGGIMQTRDYVRALEAV